MNRTNLPTIAAVVVAVFLAGGLVYYALKGSEETAGGPGAKKEQKAFEVVTKAAAPVEFQLAPVPEGDKLDLSAILRDPGGKEVRLADLVKGRALVLMMDTDLRDRRAKAATRNLRKLVAGGAELHFPIVVILPQGTSSDEAAEFARKRQLATPMYVDDNGEFAATTGWDLRQGALVAEDGTLILEFARSEAWDERFGSEPPISDDVLFWAWDIPEKGPDVPQAAKDAAIPLVRAALTANFESLDQVPGTLSAMAANPALAMVPEHEVYVCLFRHGETKRLRGMADSGSLGERIALATGRALDDAHDRKEWIAEAGELRIVIDVAGPTFPVPGREIRTLWYFFEPGVDGVVVVNGDRRGVIVPHEVNTQGILSPRVVKRDDKLQRMLAEGCRRAGKAGKAWSSPDTELLRFRTTSFGEVIPGAGAVDVYRGNVLLDEQDSGEILDMVQLGGRWLLNTVKEDGSFDYQYYPNTDEGSTDYNVVRHAGSVYGLFEMYELAYSEPGLKEDLNDYIDAGARSVGWVYDALDKVPDDEEGNRYCLLEGKRCQSGSAALSMMTYLSRPPKEHIRNPNHVAALYRADDQEKMEGLALAMVDMIDDKGAVFRTYQQAMTMDEVDKEPLYYPGECMLALVRYHVATGDQRWLDGAKAIGGRQVELYRKNRWSNPDHWVMQALYELFHATGDEKYAEVAMQMGTHHASEQFTGPREAPFPDYIGSYRRGNDVPRTTRAGSRTEAMMAVVRTAWEMGVDARIYEDAVLAATRHMSEQMFRPDNTFWMANPDRAMGALRMGIVDNHCRIDNNQHALVGMAGALEVARKREATKKAASP